MIAMCAYPAEGPLMPQSGPWPDRSRMRRAEMGHHHHVSGPYLLRYAQEAAFREDARRVDNGAQVRRVTELALHR